MITKSLFVFFITLSHLYALKVGISNQQINHQTDLWDHPNDCVNRTNLEDDFTPQNLIEKSIKIGGSDYHQYDFFTDFILNEKEQNHQFVLQKIKKITIDFNQNGTLNQEVTYLTEAYRLTDTCGEKQTYKLDHHWGKFYFSNHLRIVIKEVESGFGHSSDNCHSEKPWSQCFRNSNIYWGSKYLKDPSHYSRTKIDKPIKWVFIFFLDNSHGKMKVDKLIYFEKN